jgi:hypothetical protein
MGVPLEISAVCLFIRLLLGFILISTGISKLAYPHRFQQGILEYKLLPSVLESKLSLSRILSFCFPLAELIAGFGLVSGLLLIPATILSLGLLLLFSGAIAINLKRGRQDLSCHCAGALGEHRISWWLFGRNCLCIIGLVVLLVTPADLFTVATFIHSTPTLSSAVWLTMALPVVFLVGAVLAVLLLCNYARILLHQ